jgi:hypothetical protein
MSPGISPDKGNRAEREEQAGRSPSRQVFEICRGEESSYLPHYDRLAEPFLGPDALAGKGATDLVNGQGYTESVRNN